MTRLRKVMLEELQRRNYSAITTRNYLRVVADFGTWLSGERFRRPRRDFAPNQHGITKA